MFYESVRYKNSYAQFNNISNPRECWKKCSSDPKCIASSFDYSEEFKLPFKPLTAEAEEEENIKEEESIIANCFLYDCNIGFESFKLGWKSYSLISTSNFDFK